MTWMTQGKRRARCTGFSLPEIVLSIVILAVTMIPIAGIMGQGFLGTRRDQRQIAALQLCQARLNQALSLPFSRLVSSTTDITSGAEVLLPLGAVPGTPYTVSLTVTDVVATFTYQTVDVNAPNYQPGFPTTWVLGAPGRTLVLPDRAKRVGISVSWNERSALQTVTMESFRSDLER